MIHAGQVDAEVFSNKIIIYYVPTRMISDCVFSAIRTMVGNTVPVGLILSQYQLLESPISLPSYPTLPHFQHSSTFATLTRCFDVRPTFATFRISSHYVAPRANPSRILPIMSIRFTSALLAFLSHFLLHFTDGLASWPITSQSPLIPILSPPAHGFGLCSLALLSITFRFLDVHSPCDV